MNSERLRAAAADQFRCCPTNRMPPNAADRDEWYHPFVKITIKLNGPTIVRNCECPICGLTWTMEARNNDKGWKR